MGLYYFQYRTHCSLHVTEVSPSPLVPSLGVEGLSVQLESSSMTPCRVGRQFHLKRFAVICWQAPPSPCGTVVYCAAICKVDSCRA
ncbi:uncharacterized protein BO88DRAFT_407851 [Aspergillus vadensis CBS 113365]|uniref:Uncharacterized protein n=1 Tax=Aspergillus vadensis (strain CBS 113365 / IMI 142717 / IBT 24658) TaxID=1448311 RepID=A0A319AXV8_ASPVC|nr:hypothetical protein BO88DRAFT_407851 [Aspergillus vadensis CBS 113365]PYH65226.1 hypothetical protein BO88DRAFT_407851 [Aspergillus vadensis CBS 113365]